MRKSERGMRNFEKKRYQELRNCLNAVVGILWISRKIH